MRMLRGNPHAHAGPARMAQASRTRLRGALHACMAALLLVAAPVFAQVGAGTSPQGPPQIDGTLRDPDFGVSTTHAGLQRHVEMYQWTRAGNGYARDWRGARVDSSGFAPGHDNPKAMPLREREWHATVTLDGKPLPREIIARLGQWRRFRPDFSALPGNMSATFQPEGDGLGSAENPLAPRIGDLRVTWRALILPPLADRLVLEDGRWTLRADGDVTGSEVADAGAREVSGNSNGLRWIVAVAGAGLLALLLVAAVMRRRRRKSGD